MKNSSLVCWALGSLALSAITSFAATDASPSPSAATSSRLYVVVETNDPIAFERYRYSTLTGDDMVLPTLRTKAAAMALAAGFPDEIVVLDEDAPAPAGARILRLTWSRPVPQKHMTILGEYLQNADAKPKFLGVLNGQSLIYSPEYEAIADKLYAPRFAPDKHDAVEAARISFGLYLALERIVKLQPAPAHATTPATGVPG